ncbi:unnamed protein product [Adineta ricciae]|uniref:Uncharacterized protein n=1 Tax=Adineta ricciae TaxID=249248 RepID=A0A813QA85_ADIRI|nr:unnamed protein product [Adineta ricciae]
MQSLHYNSGSIKLTRERCTMVTRWEANEVARWIGGLANIQSGISDIFCEHNIDGVALSLLLREDLIRMGITKLDQQLIIMQSIDTLLTLVNRLRSETLAVLFMRIHCTATTCVNLLKRQDDKDSSNDNSNVINSPECYTAISSLSDAIVTACHWLGRLPFIENIEYIDLRRKIIKVLVQIRVLVRNLRAIDQINMPKSRLILDIGELRTLAISLVRQNKDSLFSSDCYLTRVHLRRPIKDDVNIEYTTMPDYTHVISSIETEAASFMGSGFSAINIGDEIIEINNQVVIGWDPTHFNELLRTSSHSNEICLLVKKMPRHNDDEVYTKRLADGPQNPRRSRARGALERRNQQTQENRTMLLEEDGIEEEEQIEVESDDETLYQSKRSSQIKRDQHTSLPDLSESLANDSNTSYNNSETSNHTIPSSINSSVSTMALTSPTSPTRSDSKQIDTNHERTQSIGASTGQPSSPNATPKSPRKTGFESYLTTIFRPRQDTKSVIADMNDHTNKDHPQLVNVRRIHSIHKQSSSTSLHDDQISSSPTPDKSGSQSSLQTSSSTRSSLSSIFRSCDQSDKNRRKRSNDDTSKNMTFRNEMKMEFCSIFYNNNNPPVVTNKPPLNHSDSRKSSGSIERRHPKRTSSYKTISCKDLGKGDCEGLLYRYCGKAALPFAQWKLCWCVLKGGTLYVFKSQDDKNQEIEIKLEGKNVSPAPEKRKYAFRIADESSKDREYFHCKSRDEMAKWMNKMGLAAINFNIDDSKIAGFNKGFVDSREGSPATTPVIGSHSTSKLKLSRTKQISSIGDSGNDSDKESYASWQKSASHHSSISDIMSTKEKSLPTNDTLTKDSAPSRHIRSASSTSILSLPGTNTNFLKPTDNNPVNTAKVLSSKGHHRTCSSPIRFPPAYEEDHENAYVNAAPRFSDSDSSCEPPHQRVFVNSQLLTNNHKQEGHQSSKSHRPLMLNSSGGFSTPTAALSSTSSDKTPSFSPSLSRSSSQLPSENSIFLLGDEELSLSSSRSASYCYDRPNSFSEDPLSPVSRPELFLPTPSYSGSQENSPAVTHTPPMYISVHPSSSPIPVTKSTLPVSKSPQNDDDSLFSRRSPASSYKTSEQLSHSSKHILTSSMHQLPNSNARQGQHSLSSSLSGTYKSHTFLPVSPDEEQN